MRLATSLRSAYLILPSNKCAVSQGRFIASLRLLVKILRSISLLNLCHGLVMIVTLKKLLDARPLQLGNVLQHLLRVCIFPFTVRVLGIEVIFGFGRDKGCLQTLRIQSLPIEAYKPRVLFENLRSLLSKSIARFSLN